MAESTVRWSDNGSVRTITLDRPPANAIDMTLLADLGQAVASATDDDAVRAVILTGHGRFFSGGFDFFAASEPEGLEMVDRYNATHRSLLALPKPTVAIINGHAVAGGLVIALACDHVIAAAGAYRVGLTEVAVGAGFPRTAVEIVRLRLTHVVATRLALQGRLLEADSLIDLGIVGALTADPVSAATDLATHLASLSGPSYRHTKAALIAPALERIDAETIPERRAGASVWADLESLEARRRMRDQLAKDS